MIYSQKIQFQQQGLREAKVLVHPRRVMEQLQRPVVLAAQLPPGWALVSGTLQCMFVVFDVTNNSGSPPLPFPFGYPICRLFAHFHHPNIHTYCRFVLREMVVWDKMYIRNAVEKGPTDW